MKKRKESILEFVVHFEPDKSDGGYVVTVPQLPGLVTQGDTLTEARDMAKDAIRCYIEGMLKNPHPAQFSQLKGRREKLALSA